MYEGMRINIFPETNPLPYVDLIHEKGYEAKVYTHYILVGKKLKRIINKDKLGRTLCLARRAKGIKLQDMADRIGVNWQTVYDWEVGLRQPRDINLKRYCRVVGISAKETLDNATE